MKKDKKWAAAPWHPLKDKNEMIKIMKEYWGENEFTTVQFYDWQYLKNPAGEPVIILARDKKNGKLAGQYVVIAANVTVAGQNLPATLSINTLTCKNYRGQGIFVELADIVYKKCAEQHRYFTYGFPNENSYYGFIKKLDFDDLGSVPLLILPVNLSKLIALRYGNTIGNICVPIEVLYERSKLLKYNNYKSNLVRKIDFFDSAYDVFWERISNKYPVMITRDSQYLNWRFFQSPHRKYYVFEVRKNGRIMGFSVIRTVSIEGIFSGTIVDFLVERSEDGETAGKALIRKSVKCLIDEGIYLIGTLLLSHTHEYRILKNCGFIPCHPQVAPRRFPVIVRTHINTPLVKDISNWYLTMADYDVI